MSVSAAYETKVETPTKSTYPFPLRQRPPKLDAPAPQIPADFRLPSIESGGDAASAGDLSRLGTFAAFHPQRRFCCEGESAQYVYRVLEGLAEGYHITANGRRQILGFYAAGDIFGFEAGVEYTIFVDAVTEGRVQIIKRSTIDRILTSNSSATTELWSCMAGGLHRSQEHVLRLGKPATERLASFILEMCDRLSGGDECHLPMTRQEIGDYLGLTIETVSRTLSQFRKLRIIQVSGNRDIVILNRHQLSQFIS